MSWFSAEVQGLRTLPSIALSLILLFLGLSLQGCVLLQHDVGLWMTEPSYFFKYQFLTFPTPKQNKVVNRTQATLNSCSVAGLDAGQYCNGNGLCKQWLAADGDQPAIGFCECFTYWADPECRTRRSSQATAFILSLLGGYLGLDLFYIGDYMAGFMKLATLGGLGFWWAYDIVRLGSGPVYTTQFRLAPDLPHWVFVFTVVFFFLFIGFLFFGVIGFMIEQRARAERLLLKAEDDFFRSSVTPLRLSEEEQAPNPVGSYRMPMPGYILSHLYSNYGTTTPPPPAPQIVHDASFGNPYSMYYVFQKAEYAKRRAAEAAAAAMWQAGGPRV